MTPHKELYLTFHDYAEGDYVPCVMCGKEGVDIHHISARGIGGSRCKDYPENLAALCRICHTSAEMSSDFNALVRIKTLEKCVFSLKLIAGK